MFGFLRPPQQPLAYRQAYARCCMFHHLHYGALALPLLSYEAVFVYLLAVDAGASTGPPPNSPRCCKLRTSRTLLLAEDAHLGRYCASLGMLLGAIKVEDDLRDGPTLAARLANWKWRCGFQRARTYFWRLDPRFSAQTGRWIDEHLALENRPSPAPLVEYAEPTARAFAYVFSLLEKAEPKMAAHKELLLQVGRRLGAAIICYDCGIDYRRDRRRGEYNPLKNEQEAAGAVEAACGHLSAAAGLCRTHFGADCRSAEVLQSRIQSLQRPPTRTVSGWARRWYINRMKRHVVLYDCPCECFCAGCDAGDCGGCEACGCDGGGSETAETGAHIACACCDLSHCCAGFDCCWCDSSSRSRKQSQTEKE